MQFYILIKFLILIEERELIYKNMKKYCHNGNYIKKLVMNMKIILNDNDNKYRIINICYLPKILKSTLNLQAK
jgi:hypothetical protein